MFSLCCSVALWFTVSQSVWSLCGIFILLLGFISLDSIDIEIEDYTSHSYTKMHNSIVDAQNNEKHEDIEHIMGQIIFRNRKLVPDSLLCILLLLS